MAGYGTLIAGKTTDGSIQNWVNSSIIPATIILEEAQALIYTKLRVRDMMARTDFAVATGFNQFSLPSDFLDPISLVPYGWGEPLEYQNESIFIQSMDEDGVLSTGTPGYYTVIGTGIVFDLELDDDFGGKLNYYAKPETLSVDLDDNFLTLRFPTLLRHACLSFAYEHLKDEQRSLDYRTKVEAEAVEASTSDELFRRGQR